MLAALDILLTYLGLNLGFQEVNPIVSYLIAQFGPWSLALWWPIEALSLYSIFTALKKLRTYWNDEIKVEHTIFWTTSIVVLWNLAQILPRLGA
jgi:hypothetical protein